MKNKIYYVSKAQAEKIRLSCMSNDNIFLAEIDGARISTEKEYVCAVWQAICCPLDIEGYEKKGWLQDDLERLHWIPQPDIALIMHNFNLMLREDKKLKTYILEDFYEIILPWWDGDVVEHMVGGVPRKFNVYLEVPDSEAGKEYGENRE